ncbi:MAG: SRPBCC family protein [Parvibaculaceae bacterium]|nr:SRPBCC family protein [Parvibaculaceae bacterium]
MQRIASENLVIECPIDEVFHYISNMENFASWFPSVKSILSKDEAPLGEVGKIYLEQVSAPFKGDVTIPITVVTCRPNVMFQTHGDYPPLMPQMTISLKNTPSSATFIDWSMASRNDKLAFRMTMLPLARIVMKKRAKVGLANLKSLLERKA